MTVCAQWIHCLCLINGIKKYFLTNQPPIYCFGFIAVLIMWLVLQSSVEILLVSTDIIHRIYIGCITRALSLAVTSPLASRDLFTSLRPFSTCESTVCMQGKCATGLILRTILDNIVCGFYCSQLCDVM